jgi:hypothetical protein
MTSDGSTITVVFRNEPRDHSHAYRLYYRHSVLWKVDKIVALLLLVFGAVSVSLVGIRWWSVVWFPLAAGDWFNLFSLHRLRIFLQFRRDPKMSETYHLTFSSNGIEFRTESINSRIEWSFYRSVLEDDEVFLLVYGAWMYTVIPRRAFGGASEFEGFRRLVLEKLGDSTEKNSNQPPRHQDTKKT